MVQIVAILGAWRGLERYTAAVLGSLVMGHLRAVLHVDPGGRSLPARPAALSAITAAAVALAVWFALHTL